MQQAHGARIGPGQAVQGRPARMVVGQICGTPIHQLGRSVEDVGK